MSREEMSSHLKDALFRKKTSLFWKLFFMMVCILALSLSAQAVSSSLLLKKITEEKLSTLQKTLEQGCEQFSTVLYTSSAIPEAIEGTRYYDYIRTENNDHLPEKYVAVVSYIRSALQKQTYLQGTNRECLLYFPGTNCLCTRKQMFSRAEDCFPAYISYEETAPEEVLAMLRGIKNLRYLPMQRVTFDGKQSENCLTLMIRPSVNNVPVMTLYQENTVLNYLMADAFPTGTKLELLQNDGTPLMQWPQAITEEEKENSYLVSCSMPKIQASVKLWIRKSYFTGLLAESRKAGTVLLLLTFMIGVALCFLFSGLSMKPIWNLVDRNRGKEENLPVNELETLDTIISTSRNQITLLQARLAESLLTSAFSGAVLSEDQQDLLPSVGIQPPYRAAIFHFSGSQKEGDSAALELMDQKFSAYPHVILNQKEIGLLAPADKEDLELLRQTQSEYNQAQNEQCGVTVGVSSIFFSFDEIYIAVRQARIALTRRLEFNIFREGLPQRSDVSWIQYDRFYQSFLGNSEDKALTFLKEIAANTAKEPGKMDFYQISFILRRVIGELGLPVQEEEIPVYDENLLPEENLMLFVKLIQRMFLLMKERCDQNTQKDHERLMQFMQENCSDPNLNIAVAAGYLKVSEKTVYNLLKSSIGVSFSDYLLQIRMKHAAELLSSGSLSIQEAARSCGYPAESTFFRVFKKYYGSTPAQFRKAHSRVPENSI